MYRTAVVELKVKLIMKVDEGVEIADVVDGMVFTPSDAATVDDSTILDYEVKDSR